MSGVSLDEQFPGSDEAFAALRGVVAVYRREATVDPTGLELEVRFGEVVGTKTSTTGVSDDFVGHAIALVQTNPELSLSDWAEVQDAFFDVDGVEWRSRTRYDTDRLAVETEVVVKRRLAECRLKSGTVAMRIVVSREAPANVGESEGGVVELVLPKHVRLQQRRTAVFASYGFSKRPTWAVDVGMAWSGGSKSEAERKKMAGETPQYTLEIELVDPAYVAVHDDAFVACSVALKAADFVDMRGEGEAECRLALLPTQPFFSAP